MIQANNISKIYKKGKREITALPVTTLTIESTKFTVIYGKSGSGKTTLLNILSGLLPPTQGQVLFNETNLYSLEDKELALFRNEKIGYIPQGTSAVDSLTVLENIILPAKKSDAVKKAEELLKRLDMEKLRDAYPGELSGGELRRMAVARALINSPATIFADEPTNDLDEENTRFVLNLLKEKSQNNVTVVVVSHDNAVLEYSDTVYEMKKE